MRFVLLFRTFAAPKSGYLRLRKTSIADIREGEGKKKKHDNLTFFSLWNT